MKATIVKEFSNDSVIIEVKTKDFEGRKLVSKEEYRTGNFAFEGEALWASMGSPRRTAPKGSTN